MPERVPPDLASTADAALRDPDDEAAQAALVDSWRTVRERHLTAYVQRAVDAAPPLTDEQRQRIARLLLGGTQ